MRQFRITAAAAIMAVLTISGISAQSLKGMSLNGATGLISVPSGRIGWEQSSSFGFDFGYHAIFEGGKATHIPKISMSILKWVELSMAFDIQPEHNRYNYTPNATDFVGSIKIQFPVRSTALALGGNFQALNMGDRYGYYGGQIYLAVTYAGQFFGMPAETTAVLGKTFREEQANWDIDFGMGFDLLLMPDVFSNFVHWVTDFANFSYSLEAIGAVPGNRGVLNTGLRIDLAAIPSLNRFKFIIDLMMTDALDDNRAFSVGLVFGLPLN